MEWISVEDRLPENYSDCLIYKAVPFEKKDSRKRIELSYYIQEYGFYMYGNKRRVTHWMPLPEPPKESEEKDEKDKF